MIKIIKSYSWRWKMACLVVTQTLWNLKPRILGLHPFFFYLMSDLLKDKTLFTPIGQDKLNSSGAISFNVRLLQCPKSFSYLSVPCASRCVCVCLQGGCEAPDQLTASWEFHHCQTGSHLLHPARRHGHFTWNSLGVNDSRTLKKTDV